MFILFQPSLIVYSDDGSNDVEEDRDARNSAPSKDTRYDPSQTYCQRKELYIDFRLVEDSQHESENIPTWMVQSIYSYG